MAGSSPSTTTVKPLEWDTQKSRFEPLDEAQFGYMDRSLKKDEEITLTFQVKSEGSETKKVKFIVSDTEKFGLVTTIGGVLKRFWNTSEERQMGLKLGDAYLNSEFRVVDTEILSETFAKISESTSEGGFTRYEGNVTYLATKPAEPPSRGVINEEAVVETQTNETDNELPKPTGTNPQDDNQKIDSFPSRERPEGQAAYRTNNIDVPDSAHVNHVADETDEPITHPEYINGVEGYDVIGKPVSLTYNDLVCIAEHDHTRSLTDDQLADYIRGEDQYNKKRAKSPLNADREAGSAALTNESNHKVPESPYSVHVSDEDTGSEHSSVEDYDPMVLVLSESSVELQDLEHSIKGNEETRNVDRKMTASVSSLYKEHKQPTSKILGIKKELELNPTEAQAQIEENTDTNNEPTVIDTLLSELSRAPQVEGVDRFSANKKSESDDEDPVVVKPKKREQKKESKKKDDMTRKQPPATTVRKTYISEISEISELEALPPRWSRYDLFAARQRQEQAHTAGVFSTVNQSSPVGKITTDKPLSILSDFTNITEATNVINVTNLNDIVKHLDFVKHNFLFVFRDSTWDKQHVSKDLFGVSHEKVPKYGQILTSWITKAERAEQNLKIICIDSSPDVAIEYFKKKDTEIVPACIKEVISPESVQGTNINDKIMFKFFSEVGPKEIKECSIRVISEDKTLLEKLQSKTSGINFKGFTLR